MNIQKLEPAHIIPCSNKGQHHMTYNIKTKITLYAKTTPQNTVTNNEPQKTNNKKHAKQKTPKCHGPLGIPNIPIFNRSPRTTSNKPCCQSPPTWSLRLFFGQQKTFAGFRSWCAKKNLLTLWLQMHFSKVLWGVFSKLSTFLEGFWSRVSTFGEDETMFYKADVGVHGQL